MQTPLIANRRFVGRRENQQQEWAATLGACRGCGLDEEKPLSMSFQDQSGKASLATPESRDSSVRDEMQDGWHRPMLRFSIRDDNQ